jgi:hypothetical protein
LNSTPSVLSNVTQNAEASSATKMMLLENHKRNYAEDDKEQTSQA